MLLRNNSVADERMCECIQLAVGVHINLNHYS